eukprot:15350589-Ditylum_brightwellii.AAC.1
MDGCLYLDDLQEEVEAAAATGVAGPSTNADTKYDEVVSESPRESSREPPAPACLSSPSVQQRQQQQQNQQSSCVWRPAWPQRIVIDIVVVITVVDVIEDLPKIDDFLLLRMKVHT